MGKAAQALKPVQSVAPAPGGGGVRRMLAWGAFQASRLTRGSPQFMGRRKELVYAVGEQLIEFFVEHGESLGCVAQHIRHNFRIQAQEPCAILNLLFPWTLRKSNDPAMTEVPDLSSPFSWAFLSMMRRSGIMPDPVLLRA